jgi:hypothetical protein
VPDDCGAADALPVWNSFSPAALMKSMNAMGIPFSIRLEILAYTVGKKFLSEGA